MSGFIIFRFMAAIILGVGGWRLAVFINQQNSQAEGLLWSILVPVGGVIIGFGLVPILWKYTRKKIIQVPADTFISALIGLTGAILISSIIAMPLSLLPSLWGQLTQPILFLVLSILGISIMVVRSHDVVPFLPRRPASLASQLGERRDNKVILIHLNIMASSNSSWAGAVVGKIMENMQ